MKLKETFNPAIEKEELAHVAIKAIEQHLKDHGQKLGVESDAGIQEALWEALSDLEVDPA